MEARGKMSKSKTIAGILGLIIYVPINLYISYWMLSQLNPDRLIWFLWIMQIPIVVIIRLLTDIFYEE